MRAPNGNGAPGSGASPHNTPPASSPGAKAQKAQATEQARKVNLFTFEITPEDLAELELRDERLDNTWQNAEDPFATEPPQGQKCVRASKPAPVVALFVQRGGASLSIFRSVRDERSHIHS